MKKKKKEEDANPGAGAPGISSQPEAGDAGAGQTPPATSPGPAANGEKAEGDGSVSPEFGQVEPKGMDDAAGGAGGSGAGASNLHLSSNLEKDDELHGASQESAESPVESQKGNGQSQQGNGGNGPNGANADKMLSNNSEEKRLESKTLNVQQVESPTEQQASAEVAAEVTAEVLQESSQQSQERSKEEDSLKEFMG